MITDFLWRSSAWIGFPSWPGIVMTVLNPNARSYHSSDAVTSRTLRYGFTQRFPFAFAFTAFDFFSAFPPSHSLEAHFALSFDRPMFPPRPRPRPVNVV